VAPKWRRRQRRRGLGRMLIVGRRHGDESGDVGVD
jgi:hypothetical protein